MSNVRPKPIIGVYEKPFWDYVQNRELRLQRCNKGHFRYPPGPSCPICMSTEFSWQKVSGLGRLISWTVFHRQYFPGLPVPYTVACGMLEEGPLLVANITGAPDQPLKLDMPLVITFEDSRTGDGDWVIYQWSATASP
jgi:uncharacterized OB-fold protein